MTVSKQIIEVLDALSDKFGIAIDWTSKEVLPQIKTVAEHYIQYELWTSVAWLIFGLILVVVVVILFLKSKNLNDGEFLWLLIAPLGLAGIIITIEQIDDIIKCLTFPELQCYEYIKDLITTKSN